MREGYAVQAFFFDDLRVELDDKLTLVGIHMQGIKINGTAPAALPQLWLGVWVTYPTSAIPKAIRVVTKGDIVDDPAHDVTMHPRQETDSDDLIQESSRTQFITNRLLSPIFHESGTISVDVFADGELIFEMNWPVIISPSPNPQVPPAIKLAPSAQAAAPTRP